VGSEEAEVIVTHSVLNRARICLLFSDNREQYFIEPALDLNACHIISKCTKDFAKNNFRELIKQMGDNNWL